ncbi:hypothetical protein AB1L88_08435 [Tautonia sp. JC769]|uniref:hypothetical protein n=1 Tax=Tautonia sp. JC769 TaxID=3232135 RepID=UPI00345B399D
MTVDAALAPSEESRRATMTPVIPTTMTATLARTHRAATDVNSPVDLPPSPNPGSSAAPGTDEAFGVVPAPRVSVEMVRFDGACQSSPDRRSAAASR